MGYPDHQEGNESRIPEKALRLFEVEGLRLHCRGLFGQVGKNCIALRLIQKLHGFGVVGKIEEGVYAAKDGRNAFEDKELGTVSK